MNIWQTILLGLVEGLTEYLPVSSTAHMMFALKLLGIHEDAFVKVLLVSIQLGAILAVIVYYHLKFFDFSHLRFYRKLIIAVLPALVLGALFNNVIENFLGKPRDAALILFLGGIVFLFIDKIFVPPSPITNECQISYKQAFCIGLWQCLAMIPGVSRSAASIMGGLQQNLSRTLAAEFSFFLAVPTMCAATGFALVIKKWQTAAGPIRGFQLILADKMHLLLFLISSTAAFIVALMAIQTFIRLVQRYGFSPWGWYRIITGLGLILIFEIYR